MEVEQMVYCLTNLGPRVSVNDLDVSGKAELTLGWGWGTGLGTEVPGAPFIKQLVIINEHVWH